MLFRRISLSLDKKMHLQHLSDPLVISGYRPDIDGIRAFAVISVLLFHAWPDIFRFGFVGVDIFFVISGYLITGIIIGNNFSLRSFYQHRIIRILPPLCVVLAASLLIGWFLLTPEEYERLGAHLRSSSIFGANFHLLGEEGYFDVAGTKKPLLHLWSLAIEEQFYLVYPLLLVLVARYGKALFGILVLVSLSLVWASFIDTGTMRFYSPLSRAFELGVGGVACLTRSFAPLRRHPLSLSLLGFLFLGISVYMAGDHGNWPNRWTVILCIGIGFLLNTGSAICRAVFANRAMVFVGLISYELYLWHWPLLSFGLIVTGGQLSHRARIILLLLALMLSIASYFIFEKPIRSRFRNDWRMGGALLGCLVILGVCGHILTINKGFPKRIDNTRPVSLPQEWLNKGNAFYPDWKKFTKGNNLYFEDELEKIDVALIGDSHAGHLIYGFIEALGGRKKLALFPASGHTPWPGLMLENDFKQGRKEIYKSTLWAYDTIAKYPNIKTVVIGHYPIVS